MKDVFAPEVLKWQHLEGTARQVLSAFGYTEVKIPVLEHTDLFARSIGEATDIVEKEMYTFADRSGDSLTMRPEATAGILRAYVEHKLYAQPGPHKVFTMGPMFRHERPQKGRLRQFHQLDVEILGDDGPMVDAELMVMLAHLLSRLGLEQVTLLVNSLGCPECRPAYRRSLVEFLSSRKNRLCPDCRRRLAANPLRVLDCKVESCQEAVAGAPVIADHLCSDCVQHFDAVKQGLTSAEVSFEEAPHLVRGLDYYVRTTFEAVTGQLGAQNAVAGGGRYDGLIEMLGGPSQGAIGFAAGLERLVMILPGPSELKGPDLFVAALGAEAREWAFPRVQQLRREGLWVEMTPEDKSLKAQMRRADKMGSQRVLIIGGDELKSGQAVLKNMTNGEQAQIALTRLHDQLLCEGVDQIAG
jgi:histidyl-tRNA synthetase